MESFNYYNPTKILFGDKHKQIADILKADGHTRILLIYGQNSIKKMGLYDGICSILNQAGISFIEHGGVKSNPVLSHAREGVAKSKDVTAILAVGGGSVIDEAKAIAAAAFKNCDPWDFYCEKCEVDVALDLYTILTVSATGSEMNDGTVLTNEKTQEKLAFTSPLVFPKVSIVNPSFTKTLPREYLVYSAIDIIAHTIEVYFTCQSHPNLQNRFSENIVQTVMETTEAILKNSDNLSARNEFALSATWALNGLTKCGVGKYGFPNHMIEHSLSAIYDVPHGAGLAVVILAWLKWFEKTNNPQIARFAKTIFGKDDYRESVKMLEQWFKKIGAPTKLQDLNIPKQDIKNIAKNAFGTSLKWEMSDIYTQDVIEEILLLA